VGEQAVTSSVPEASGLFVRRSSGLIREFRPSDVFVFNTLGYALGLVLMVVPTFIAALWPEQNVLLVVTIGTALTIFNAAMYGYLAGVMPRSGGDYVYLSRVIHPSAGFTANWGSPGRSSSGSVSIRRSPSTSASQSRLRPWATRSGTTR